MGGFKTEKVAMLHDAEALRMPHVDKTTHAILVSVVKFNTNIKLVRPKVIDTNGMYSSFILQHVIDKKPKSLVSRSNDSQRRTRFVATSMSMATVTTVLCHRRQR